MAQVGVRDLKTRMSPRRFVYNVSKYGTSEDNDSCAQAYYHTLNIEATPQRMFYPGICVQRVFTDLF